MPTLLAAVPAEKRLATQPTEVQLVCWHVSLDEPKNLIIAHAAPFPLPQTVLLFDAPLIHNRHVRRIELDQIVKVAGPMNSWPYFLKFSFMIFKCPN